MNIILIGYRGTGKTTVGRLLAERLGWGFVDTDKLIVQRTGMTIKDIFAKSGEAGFRKIEAHVVRDVTIPSTSGGVIAVGGGAILRLENLAAFKRTGNKVVWLTATPEVLAARIRGDAGSAENRPSLMGVAGGAGAAGGGAGGGAGGDLEEIRQVLVTRTPIYQATADWSVAVGTLTVEEVVEQILAWWASQK